MLVLRADPWDPSYGMGLDAPQPDEAQEMGDPSVETDDWSAPLAPPPGSEGSGPISFVDGVERVELGLVAEDDGRQAPGLFGSHAVGSVHVDGRATFGDARVERVVVTGGGMRAAPVEVPIGRAVLRFDPVSEDRTEPERPRLRLLGMMRRAEAALARELAGRDGRLVLADGRLAFPEGSGLPIVGFVKRFMRHHLPQEQGALLARLEAGTRTPLFALGREETQRYSWYVRLVPLPPHWHDYAGLVRCEVATAIGRDAARALADRVAALLPRYAGSAADPRTPQNLAPVARLESELRRRMGDARLVRRELLQWVIRRGGNAA